MARILVVEPWYGGSHRAWLDGWRQHSRHDLTIITRPAQFWRWRMRGSSVELGREVARVLGDAADTPFEALVISGLTDAASLLGQARRATAALPVALYLHENQLLYPVAPGQRVDDQWALANWRSMEAVDRVWFNSAFHRDALLAALPSMLARHPERNDGADLDEIRLQSSVLWPGAHTAALIDAESPPRSAVPLVLWNQRWDHDKNPRSVMAALAEAANEGLAFELALLGEAQAHSTFDVADQHPALAARIVAEGFQTREAYLELLLRSDVVVSAADHEFFGIAIVEAIAAGAVPVLPDRLSFPELVDERWHASVLYPQGHLRSQVKTVLRDVEGHRSALMGIRESMRRFDVAAVAEDHDAAVDALIASIAVR